VDIEVADQTLRQADIMKSDFISGLELSRRFYFEAVLPVIDRTWPGLRHGAARMGNGSEVLGFDTERSSDHEWGPRLQVFLAESEWQEHADLLTQSLARQLPKQFLGYPTHFESPDDGPIGVMKATDGPVNHRVAVTTTRRWFVEELGFVPLDGVSIDDWMSTPTQLFAAHTAGEVFRDELDELARSRELIDWYPDDAWRYVLASQWQKISQEEAFVGRTGEVGDEIGSAVITARLVRELMRLSFLLERTWAPYSKWLGTAFGKLPIARELEPHLTLALQANFWKERESALGNAYQIVARRQNSLGLCEEVDPTLRRYHDRPFLVIRADRFATALRSAIEDDAIMSLPLVGAVDQFIDNTDVSSDHRRARATSSARSLHV
jgi:hypothetical protein